MTALRLGRGLSLPKEAVTQRFGILAVSGAGKSNTAAVMAEEMFRHGLPFVVVDPKGDWWGLRSTREGKPGGLAIPIFGGRHGDVPLHETNGQVVADLAVDERLSFVLDISDFDSEAARKRFLLDFAQRLFRRSEEPLHLFLEEADDYIPQQPMKDEKVLLRAWTNIIRRGRTRGLGATLITQRSASLNKNVLTQVENLVVLRTTGPQDRKAIEAWVDYHAQSRKLLDSLPELEDGEGWIWSPQWLKTMKRVHFRRRTTFDSGATPAYRRRGSRPAATMGQVDLKAIQARMKETIEKARAEDPRELRRRIRELEKEACRPAATPEPQRVEVPILMDGLVEGLREVALALRLAADKLSDQVDKLHGVADRLCQVIGKATHPAPAPRPSVATPARPTRQPRQALAISSNGNISIKAGAVRMLRALASRHPSPLSRHQVATLARISPTSGTFTSYLSNLNKAGLITERPDGLHITSPGLEHLGPDFDPVPDTTSALLAMWASRFKAGARRMLKALVEAHPQGLTRGQLGETAGISSESGTFTSYLSNLRRNRLIEEDGGVIRASETLFP